MSLLGSRWIEPNTGLNPFLRIALNDFCMHKTNLFKTFFNTLEVIIGIKPAPGDY